MGIGSPTRKSGSLRPRHPARGARSAAAAIVAAALVVLPPARAAGFDLDLRMQGQIIGLGAFSLPEPAFGTAEIQVNASLWSIGAALGVAYERYPSPDGDMLNAGAFHAAFQWRFMALVDRHVFAWFDPHIDLGMELGGARGESGGESWFRGVGYGGLSLDVAFPYEDGDPHLVLTVQYRWSPPGVHVPDTAPQHLLLLGIGVRVASD